MTEIYQEAFGQGEPVVMLHGWAMHTGIWRSFAKALSKEKQVICMDLPGHGHSGSISPYTMEVIVDAIHDALPKQPCIIVGWSLGGNIALRLAEKYPQRVKSLVLIGSNPHFLQAEQWPGVNAQVLKEFASNLQKNTTATLLRFMSLQLQGMADIKVVFKEIKAAMQECEPPKADVLLGGLEILRTVDLRIALRDLVVPVQIILGDLDTLVPVVVGKQCKQLQSQLEIEVITRAGHMPFITHQQQVIRIVNDFIVRSVTK
ncbi:MAG: pimeloyl-[acyl-carrier protein] methyl ester esterase [Methyloprofundus sp.]|nr:MAG: pimeloyl-[acyl-carrier protein] methyl ester esterase [Methyloprofundus sp.]